MKTGARRKARELGLSILFASDVGEQGAARALMAAEQMLEVMMEHWDMDSDETEKLKPEIQEFGTELARMYFLDATEIDRLIEEFSHDWAIDRMPGIDRNILRLAIGELKHFPDVPISATINEAVELAKIYGTEESGKFVNGILGAYVRSEQAPVDGS
ncbi:MAG: transcription antitermination factor NusB [Armatimonadota bacterium]